MILKLDKLGTAGMVSDMAPHDLPSQAFSVAEAVSFRDGKAKKSGGYRLVNTIADDFPTWMQPWLSGGIQRIAVLMTETVQVLESGIMLTAALQNQAGAATTLTTSRIGQSTTFGDYCVLNNGTDYPLYSWNSATSSKDGSVFRQIPGWGAATSPGGSVKVIRGFGSFLMAIGVTDAPYSFYWSDEAEPNAFPMSWDYADPTNLAGTNTVSASDGILVNGEPLGNDFIIYAQRATYAARFVGGAYIFDTRRLWPWGCLNQDCVVQFENQHFVVADEAVFVHDGNSNTRIAAGRIERQLFSEISDLSKVRVSANLAANEILIYYPRNGASSPNRACIWNWITNTWNFRDLPWVACIAESPQPTTGLLRFSSPEAAIPIDSAPWTADSLGASDPRRRLFMVTAEGEPIFDNSFTGFTTGALLEYGTQYVNATRTATAPYYAYVERTGLDLENLGSPAARSLFIRGLYPQMRGSGVVQVQIGAAQTPNGEYLWDDPQAFDLNDAEAYKIDTRLTGKYVGYRIGEWEGAATSVSWELTGVEIDVQDGGR